MCVTRWWVWDLGHGLAVSSILTVFGLLIRIRLLNPSFRVSPCICKQLYGGASSSFSSAISLALFSSLEFLFLILWPDSWGIDYSFCRTYLWLHPHLDPSGKRKEKNQMQWRGCSTLSGSHSTSETGRCSSLWVLALRALVVGSTTASTGMLGRPSGRGPREGGEKGQKRGFHTVSKY